MGIPAKLSKVHLALTPTQWLIILSGCALLAALSGMLLVSRVPRGDMAWPNQAYDRVERFILDTIRLSFTNRILIARDVNVYVAPLGLLEKDAILVMLDGSQVYEDRAKQDSVEALAPKRILDSDWNPTFPPTPLETGPR